MTQAQRKPREKRPEKEQDRARTYGPYTPSRPYKKPSGPLSQLAALWKLCFPFAGNPPRNYYEHQQRRYRAWFLVVLVIGVVVVVGRVFRGWE